jgi:hypothetical protein
MTGILIPTDSITQLDSTTVLQQYPAPAEYAQWMQEIIACAGLTAVSDPLRNTVVPAIHLQPADIAWVAVPGVAFRIGHGPLLLGLTVPSHSTILLLQRYAMMPQLVKHETLHLALYLAGRPYGHTEADWLFTKCGVLGQ